MFPDHVPLPGDSQVPPGASSSASPVGAPPFDSSTSVSQGPTSGVYALLFFFGASWRGAWVFVLLLTLNIC